VLPSSVEIRPVSAENQCGEGGECLGAALTRRILPASEVMSTRDRKIRCVTRGQRESVGSSHKGFWDLPSAPESLG
jgi:hypothetical protein